ncbi:ABC transporter ATP-binding protein [bacterium]|nr:ABC transporter ATP-binding protein [bacterium]
MAELALEVKELVKVYDPKKRGKHAGTGPVRALDGLSLEVREGELLGVLGPNGAGKTTAMRTIATLVRPTSGTVKIAGVDVEREPDRARMLLGYVSQEIALDRLLTVREHLVLAARLHRLTSSEARKRADEVLALVRLEEKADVRSRKLSGGMKKRVELGMGLVHHPKLLVLDEPTVGLDLDSRRALWDFLQGLKASGTGVLLATHSIEEAERLSDKVAIVDRGRVQRVGAPAELKAETKGDVLEVVLEGALPDDGFLEEAKKLEGARAVTRTRDGFEVATDEGARTFASLAALLTARGRAARSITYRKPTLEDVFLRVAGREFREEPV